MEDSLGLHPSLLLSIETVLGLTKQAGWLESPRDPPVSGSPLLGIRGQATMLGFFYFLGMKLRFYGLHAKHFTN